MKIFLSFLMIICIVSCKKSNPDPGQNNPGIIEGYLIENPSVTVQKTTESTTPYIEAYATDRGYDFKPLKDIRITEIGGRIAETGKFQITINNIDNGWSKGDGWIAVLIDTINITKTNVFQYKTVNKEVILLAGHKYLISYFNQSHNSLYDAQYIQVPLTIGDIEIERMYYAYYRFMIGGYLFVEASFTNGLGMFRGLVDIKYELVE